MTTLSNNLPLAQRPRAAVKAQAAAATPTIPDVIKATGLGQPAKVENKTMNFAIWAAGASVAGAVVLGILGKPVAAVITGLSAIVDLGVAWFMDR